MQFAEMFENEAALGGITTIRERLNVLATKGFVKFIRGPAAEALGLSTARLKFGYLCVEGMQLGAGDEAIDPDTGEVAQHRFRHGGGLPRRQTAEPQGGLAWLIGHLIRSRTASARPPRC